MDETKYWLWLSMIFGTGSSRIWDAISLYETAAETYSALNSDISGLNLKDKEIRNITGVSIEKASEYIEQCRKIGIGVIGYSSEEYPKQLRHIFNPPAVLYYRGNISCLNGTRTITAVGTRNPTNYGLDSAYRICGELARNGFVIVSGFAIGTDITSHIAAADAQRPTACVMRCGLDVDYPKNNFMFRDIILENGGVFISEYPLGTPPHAQNFPKRNRILAALGMATMIFEAAVGSGSLITADLAAEQGREVFCLPPADIFSKAFSGNIELLRDGATPLYSVSDVIDIFRIGGALDMEIRSEEVSGVSSFGRKSIIKTENTMSSLDMIKSVRKRSAARKKSEKNENNAAEQEKTKEIKKIADNNITEEMTDIQKKIYGLFSEEALHADFIAQKLEFDTADLMTELTELEILGAIRSLPGKMFEICG